MIFVIKHCRVCNFREEWPLVEDVQTMTFPRPAPDDRAKISQPDMRQPEYLGCGRCKNPHVHITREERQ